MVESTLFRIYFFSRNLNSKIRCRLVELPVSSIIAPSNCTQIIERGGNWSVILISHVGPLFGRLRSVLEPSLFFALSMDPCEFLNLYFLIFKSYAVIDQFYCWTWKRHRVVRRQSLTFWSFLISSRRLVSVVLCVLNILCADFWLISKFISYYRWLCCFLYLIFCLKF